METEQGKRMNKTNAWSITKKLNEAFENNLMPIEQLNQRLNHTYDFETRLEDGIIYLQDRGKNYELGIDKDQKPSFYVMEVDADRNNTIPEGEIPLIFRDAEAPAFIAYLIKVNRVSKDLAQALRLALTKSPSYFR